MSQPLLSILICTIPKRKKLFNELIDELKRQRNELNLTSEEVEILVCDSEASDGTINSIGRKSNSLFHDASGEYKCRFDDDDAPHLNYLFSIINAIKVSHADIITFNIAHYLQGNFEKTFFVNTKDEQDTSKINGIYRINRVFFHLMPHKKELADKIRFPETNWQEDMAYTELLKPLIKTEHHIDESLYNYYQIPKQH